MSHACALKNGGVLCWGLNGFGQLGNNSTTASPVPVPVLFPPPVTVGGIAEQPDATALPSAATALTNHTTAYALGGVALVVVAVAGAGGWYVRRKRVG